MRVKARVALPPIPFPATIWNGYTPPVVGVPEIAAVPFPLSVNVTPGGGLPDSDHPHVGHPVDVAVNVAAWPTSKVARVEAGDPGTLGRPSG